MSEEIKRKVGRPTSYLPEYCEKLEEYFDQPLYIEVEVEVGTGFKAKTKKVLRPNSLPTFEGFMVQYRLTLSTVQDWKTKHENFRVSWERCKNIQKRFLVEHGLMNNYNSNFAKFVALNFTDMMDDPKKEKQETNNFSFNISKTGESSETD